MLVRNCGSRLTGLTALFRSFSVVSGTCNSSLSDDVLCASDPFSHHPSRRKLGTTFEAKGQFFKSGEIRPPIKWPENLNPKRMVKILNRSNNVDRTLQIFNHADQHDPGFTHTYETYKAMIDRLCRARAFEEVETLLTGLRRSNIICREGLFIIVIRGYGVACKPKLAFKTFLRIDKEFRVKRSVGSFNYLLNAFIKSKEFHWVYIIFKNCRKKFSIVPNVNTCHLVVKALCQKGDVEGAVRILDEMPQMGLVPAVISYTTVLGGYVARGDMIAAKRVFDEILDRGFVDATTYIILMDGFVKIGRPVDAIKVMEEMEENGIEPNLVTYEVMIEAYCKAKKSGEATNLINEMLAKKCIPSTTVCCKLIDLLCEQGQVQDACNLWTKLLIKNVIPDNAVSSTLIHWLCKEGKVEEARSLFNEFDRCSVPSLLTYNTLIAGMCENGDVYEAGRLWDYMVEKGCKPNVLSYNMLIKGMCKCGDAKAGIIILEEMLAKRCWPNKLTSSILIKGLSDSGCEADIQRVLDLVASKGRGIGPDCWADVVTIFVSDVENTGVVLDRVLSESVI